MTGDRHRAAILQIIETHSSNPDLNARSVAHELGVTARYVHLLLAQTGGSFTQHLLERRLHRAAALLRNPAWRDRKIAEISAQAGFADLSYFNRAFRRRFGTTPSAFRNAGPPVE
ncbi:MAG: helix-turn-helix transcriptional regulator [Alphaproteobacteria bacterium]|nr:helix-turn-helix transcriptional regulator [Alphaproteobacteria bacterium]